MANDVTQDKPIHWEDISSEAKGTTGLSPGLASKFDSLAQSYYQKFGEPLKLMSGHRTYEHQARLYAADPNSGYVAKPGNSSHETGNAFDIDKAQALKIPDAVLSDLDLHRPMKGQGKSGVNEPWHIQEAPAQGVAPAKPAAPVTYTPGALKVLADETADKYSIPRDIFRALIGHESSWNHKAANPESSALGIGQFLDETSDAYKLGLKTFPRGKGGTPNPADERLDAPKALDAAARLLLAKSGPTWREKVKNYGEGTDAYLQRVMKQWEADKTTQPTPEEIRASYGLPPEPSKTEPASLGVGTRLAGHLEIGASKALGRLMGLANTVVGPETAAAFSGLSPATEAEMLQLRKATEQIPLGTAAHQVEANPETSFLGQVAGGLVETIPELPLFAAAGEGAGAALGALALRGGPIASEIATRAMGPVGEPILGTIGRVAGALSEYISPTVTAGASMIGQLPRVALHGALTGAVLGGASAPPGERLQEAGTEATQFAVAAPAFHVAGKVIGWGLSKALGKLANLPSIERFVDMKGLTDSPAWDNVPGSDVFGSYKEAKRAFQGEKATNPDVKIGMVGSGKDLKWTLIQPTGTPEPVSVKVASTELPTPVVETPTAEVSLPSGAPTTVIKTTDGKTAATGDYSKETLQAPWGGMFERKPVEEPLPAGMDKAEHDRWNRSEEEVAADLAAISKRKTLADEVAEAKLKEAEVTGQPPEELKGSPDVAESFLEPAITPAPKREVQVEVAPTGEVETKVVRKSKTPEQDRVQAELDEVYPASRNRDEELIGAKVLYALRAKQFEREGQGTKEDFYKSLQFKSADGTPNYKAATEFEDGKVVIKLFKKADFSSVVHEGWHYFENTLPENLLAELSAWRGKEYTTWTKDDYEHTARAFERWWAQGGASPEELKAIGITAKVAKVFQEFKQWLLDIYTGIKGQDIDVELNKDLENVFRKALGLGEKVEVAEHIKAEAVKLAELPAKRTLTPEEFEDRSADLHTRLAEAVKKGDAAEVDRLKAEYADAKARVKEVTGPLYENLAELESKTDRLYNQLQRSGKGDPSFNRLTADYDKAMQQLFEAEKAVIAYEKSGQTSAFVTDNIEAREAGITTAMKDTTPEQEVARVAEDASRRRAREIASRGGKRILHQAAGSTPEDVQLVVDEVGRSEKSYLRMLNIDRAYTRDTASRNAIGEAINIKEILDVGKELGMAKEIAAAEKAKDIFSVRDAIFKAAEAFIDAARVVEVHKDGTITLGVGTKVELTSKLVKDFGYKLKTANDAIEKWHNNITFNKPKLLEESPGEKYLRNFAVFVADKIGIHPEAVDSLMWKATKTLINMQNLSYRYPILRPLFDLQVKRASMYSDYSKALMEGDGTKIARGWRSDREGNRIYAEFSPRGFSSMFELHRTNPEAAKVADRLLLAFDQNGKAPRLTEEDIKLLAPVKALPKDVQDKVARAMTDFRETCDYTYFQQRNDFEDNLPAGLTAKEHAVEMKKWDKEHVYHPNWVPHIREGKYRLTALDEEGNTLYHTQTNSPRELKILEEQAKKDYPGARVFASSAKESSRVGISGAALQQFVNKVTKEMVAKSPEAAKEARLFSEIAAKNLKAYGLTGHYLGRRSPEGIPGFEDNLRTIMTSYTQLYSTHVGKLEFLRKAYDEIGNLKYYKDLQDYARKWVDLTIAGSDQIDRTVSHMKNVAFLRYLGATFKAPLLHVMNKMTFVEPLMSLYTNQAKSRLARAMPDGARFVKWVYEVDREVGKMKLAAEKEGLAFNLDEAKIAAREKIKSPLNEADTAALLQLKRQGTLDPQWINATLQQAKNDLESADRATKDVVSASGHYISKAYKQTLHYAGLPLGYAESYGRLTTALAAHRMFLEQYKYSPTEAIEAAGRFTLDAHGYFSKSNLPLGMMRGMGKLAKLPMTFKLFEYHYLNLLGNLWSQGASGKLQAAKSLSLLGAIGGVASIPFLTGANKLFRAATGTDAETWLQKQLNQTTNMPLLTDILTYGIPGASPLGITPAIAMKSSMSEETISDFLFGAPGKVLEDGVAAAGSAFAGDWDAFLNKALPAGLNNAKKAYERYTYGALGPSGNKLTLGIGGEQIKYSVPEAVGQVFGFTPATMEKYYSRQEVMKAEKEHWTSQRQRIFSLVARAINKGDEAGLAKAFERINAYNSKALATGADVQVITPQMVKQSLKDRVEKRAALQAERLGFASPGQ